MTKKSLALAAVLALCLASPGFAQSSTDSVPRMKQEQFKKLLAEQVVTVLDVRTPAEYEEGHIPGAQIVPLAIVTSYLPELSQEPRPIVTYCS
jgi:3-mercaptopyruvate sulfurtransferase SseA